MKKKYYLITALLVCLAYLAQAQTRTLEERLSLKKTIIPSQGYPF
ncbi:hypothetical protein ADIS_0461 [Lunatimonas lonarensis]|uniref:Uncharacterized protein n=1 Tax=Lunatimonas lonarensis TaxID=1232681 RepID=R7ZYB2_9BACT|nr:hypothetical protein ADIS_0461 [Lunatimonas lonarensis]